MKKYIIPLSIVTLLLLLLSIGLMLATSFMGDSKQKPVVYMIVKSNQASEGFEFWESVKMGAQVAATELDAELIFTGPSSETEVDEQTQLVEAAIKEKPMAIVIAATDYERLNEVGRSIIDHGITLVTVDSGMSLDIPHSYIGTDNVAAASDLADEVIKMLQGKGQVAVLSFVEGAATAIERETGFRQVMNEADGIDLISETWFCDGSIDKAYDKTMEILEEYPQVSAIFGANEVAIGGIARAIAELGLKDQVKVVGFDSNEEIVGRIETGVIDKIIVQKPFNMGYQGVKEAISIYNREKKPETIDTGAVLIDKENLYTPENQKLLFPF